MPPPLTYGQQPRQATALSRSSSASLGIDAAGHLQLHSNGLIYKRTTITSTATRTIHIMYATDALSESVSTEAPRSSIDADVRVQQDSKSSSLSALLPTTTSIAPSSTSLAITTPVQLPTAPTNPIGQPQSTSIALIAITASLGGVAMIILIIWLLSQWRGRRFLWLGKY